MADVKKWEDFLTKWEDNKGMITLPDDAGGATNHGISFEFVWKRYAPTILGVPATKETLAKMDNVQWDKLVRGVFWDVIQGDKINSQAVAEAIADYKFHGGINSVNYGLQATLNQLGHNLRLDGVFGPKTIAAINATAPDKLFPALLQNRWKHLQNFAKNNPVQVKYIQGWYNRLSDQAKRFNYAPPTPAPGAAPAPLSEKPKPPAKKKKSTPEP